MKTVSKFALALVATLSFAAPPAMAQPEPLTIPPYDHLRCYKIKDSSNYLAKAALVTNDLQRQLFPDAPECKLTIRSRELCVPVAKLRQFEPNNRKEAPHLDVMGQSLTNDFLCYTAKCKSDVSPDIQRVYDQFGERDVRVGKTVRLCTPTYKVMDQQPEPDLVPVPASPTGDFCARTANNQLIVEVKNQGGAMAGLSDTRVKFDTGFSIDVPTPPIGPGATHQFKVPIPTGCFDPNCHFDITADGNTVVVESDEVNNLQTGVCRG